MAEHLKARAALPEDQGLIHRAHVVDPTSLK